MTADAPETGATPEGGPEILVITGMSGAGRSTTIHAFEDQGYFCIDNLPPHMIRQVVELAELPGSAVDRVAVVCDVRGLAFFEELKGSLDELEREGYDFRLVFLEADDRVLLQRFKETRRPHPLAESGNLSEGIEAEREMLQEMRGRADVVIDTSELRPVQLRKVILDEVLQTRVRDRLSVNVGSFGFKYGVPLDADIVMDVRFIPNPFYDIDLRPQCGLDEDVRDYVMGQQETERFLDSWLTMLSDLAPNYLAEGKTYLSIALGCTGGMHRSVVLAEETADYLRAQGYRVIVTHRDIEKDRDRT
jgi:UPF0042 nucleotide-binding protein